MSACSISSDHVDYTDGETIFEAYVATPQETKGKRPCVLLSHEWSGLNEGMKRIADRLAKLGYVGFAIDVYGKGIRGDQRGDNAYLMAPLMANRGLLRRRLLAGFDAALRHPAVDPSHVAVMGYCFGGLCALDLARAAPRQLLAAISFHGVLAPPNLGAQGPIKASVLLLHGWEDPMAPPRDVLAFTKEFSDAGADWQLHAYGHAMHAFTFEGVDLPERGLAHNPAADRRSWSAMRVFLEEKFGEAPPEGISNGR